MSEAGAAFMVGRLSAEFYKCNSFNLDRVFGKDNLDHVVVLGEARLRRIVRSYVSYYHRARTHLALEKDAPEPRCVQPPDKGSVIEISEVGGFHHRYERRAA